MRRSLAVAAVVLALGSSARAEEGGEEIAGPFPWRADESTLFLRRIVDAATGKPVSGAVLKLYCEVPHPEPGFGTPVASVTSGPDGWVRVGKDAVDSKVTGVYGPPTWAYVEANGLRPDAVYGDFLADAPDWPLGPSTTVRVALRDPLDRPVVDALVGWLLGCGHTPDVRQARTDAQGVATIEHAALGGYGHLWPVKEGVESRYVEREAWAPWERPRTARLGWAPVVEGVVLTHEGKPAAGVGVGVPEFHRGPWTRTDIQGRFRLIGVDAVGADVQIEAGEYAVGPRRPSGPALVFTEFESPPSGKRVVVRLPAPGTEAERESPTMRLVVEVEREGWPEAPEATVVVEAVRRGDGWFTGDAVREQGVALLRVPPGTYDVAVSGRADHGITFSRAETTVVVPETGGVYVSVALPRAALVRLVVPPADDLEGEILVEGESQWLFLEDAGETRELWVPADRPVFLRVTQGARSHLLRIDPTDAVGGKPLEVRVPALEAVEVRARLVDGDGKPVPGWLLEAPLDLMDRMKVPKDRPASEAPTLAVLPGERIALVVRPQDERRHQPSIVDVPVLTAGTPLDLGAVLVRPRQPEVRLEVPPGAPRESPTVLVTRGDRAEELETWRGDGVRDPWFAPGLVAEGAVVRVPALERFGETPSAVHVVPYVRRLEGAGPWTLRLPAGMVTVTPQRSDAAALGRWGVLLDGHRYAADGPTLTLAQVEDGPHELVVDVSGTTPKRVRFTLAKEPYSWAPRLRASPR